MLIGRKLLGGVTIVLLTLFTFSCENPFNPEMRKQSETAALRSADSPEILLQNLEDAYNRMDIDLYKSCLSKSFRFVIISSEKNDIGLDIDDDGLSDDWWDYDVEVRYTENLFGCGSTDGLVPAPVSISLDLQVPSSESWGQDSDSANTLIIPCYFDLRLTYSGNYQDIVANGYALFYVVEEDGVWKVVRWQDESNI